MNAVDLARDLWLLLAALGLNLAVGHAGQPVLGQGAFVAAGGYGGVLLADEAGWPLGLAVLTAVAGACVLGWLVDYGASRLQGPFLALGTWGLAWLALAVVEAFPGVFGGAQGLVRDTPAAIESRWLGVQWSLTAWTHVGFALLLCALALAATAWLRRSPLGLDLAALRDSPVAAGSVGVRVASLRRGTLAAAAAVGALAGAGTALLLGVVAPSDVSPLLSVQLFVAVLLGGTATVWGPVLGVAVIVSLPWVADRLAELTDVAPERSRGVLTAALLVAVLVVRGRVRRRFRHRARAEPLPEPLHAKVSEPGEVLLEARGIAMSYDALKVLDGAKLTLRAGQVHALIGPNGSGKTTLLRVLAGALPPDAGTVTVAGRDVTRLPETERVRAGIARTFQRTVLFPGLSVRRHVAVGARAREPYGAVRVLLATPKARAAHAEAQRHVAAMLEVTDLTSRAALLPEQLDHGDQRLLQVARAAATGARVLLLDEPAAGLAPDTVARLAAAVRRLAGNGVAVLFVEHDMRFVASLADTVTVLSEGRVIAAGTPDAVRRDPAVRRAYLGEGVPA